MVDGIIYNINDFMMVALLILTVKSFVYINIAINKS